MNMSPQLQDQAIPDLEQLPSYQVIFQGQRRSDICILIPIINEGQRILKQLRQMKEADFGLDLIIVDGGSSDGSTEPERLQHELGVNTLLLKTGAGKLSAQLRIGMAWAMQRDYQGIVTIDGNGKDDIDAIPRFRKKLEEGYDQVQGSRYLPDGVAENTPWDREIGVKLVHAPLISLAAGFHYTDTTNGFRGFSRRLLLDPRVRPFRDIFSTYNLHYYLAVRAARLGFKVCEIAVARRYPAAGPTPSKIGGFSGKLHILKQTFLTILGAYNPK